MELSSNDRPIRRVLAETFFLVPRYQRPYSWTRDNVEDLWDDAMNGAEEYFIGSLVVHPAAKDTMALVDGQQRLTTLLMILCAVRDVAEEQQLDKLANGTHNLIERRDEDDNLRPVLKSETAKAFLGDYVLNRGEGKLGDPKGEEQEAIRDAFDQIKDNVRGKLDPILEAEMSGRKRDDAMEEALKSIRDTVLGLKVIFVETGTHDEAITVFVTLNSRGKDLEPSDLVKAHLLRELPKASGTDSSLERWQKIIELFDASAERPDMTEFLIAFWRSRYGSATKRTLDREVRKQIKDSPSADLLLTELTQDAEYFRTLLEPSYHPWGQHSILSRSLEFMVDFRVRQPWPLLLSLLRAYDAQEIKVAQLRRSLSAIENYHFTYNVLAGRSSTGGMSSFYASRALKLNEASNSQERGQIIDDLVKELKDRRPGDEEFDIAFKALAFTDDLTVDKKKIQYVLRRFHEFNEPKAPVDFSLMTIEHLTAQSSGDDYVGQLGNLIYVSETLNGRLGNKSFQEKLKQLKAAKEWIPSDVLDAKRWSAKAVERRTERMAIEGRERVWR
jgi:hypothetical protein